MECRLRLSVRQIRSSTGGTPGVAHPPQPTGAGTGAKDALHYDVGPASRFAARRRCDRIAAWSLSRRWKRRTCENCLSIDVRQWHREGCLRAGQRFTRSWTWCGEALGSVVVQTEADAVILTLKSCSSASGESKSLGQRVPLVWTRCHFGGARPWFQCTGHSDGQGCGRRAAKLYLGRSSAFACRCCHNRAYASQSENRGIAPSAERKSSGCALVGAPICSNGFPQNRA